MVTPVSGFIEQVGSVIKGIPHTCNYHPSTLHNSIKELAQTLVSKTTYISNRQLFCSELIITSRWMHMNWVSASLMDCEEVD